MDPTPQYSDLSVEVFIALQRRFLSERGMPREYPLRDKVNSQDDPLDEYLGEVLSRELGDAISVVRGGSLTNPDLVIVRPRSCEGASRTDLSCDLTRILGVEVKSWDVILEVVRLLAVPS